MMASGFHRCIMYIVVINVGTISEVALHEELHASFHSSPIKTELLISSPPHNEKIISPEETTKDADITEKEVVGERGGAKRTVIQSVSPVRCQL